MKKYFILLSLTILSLSTKVNAQTFKFEQYNLNEFDEFLEKIEPNHKYYFDLDNTLIVINDYKYGSDGWTDIVSKSILQDSLIGEEIRKDMLSYLFDGLTPENFNKLNSVAVKENYPRILNMCINEPTYSINGLTSRSNNVNLLTINNLKSAGYNERLNIYYTTGGNKGNYIYNVYNNEGSNKTIKITYVDDTYSKLTDAYESMKVLFKGQKNVYIKLVHLKNTDAKVYEEASNVSCDFTDKSFDNSLKENCNGDNIIFQGKLYYSDFKKHYFFYKKSQAIFIEISKKIR